MRKDSLPAQAPPPSPPSISCLDLRPFIATLVILTLITAVYQLQPYETLLSSSRSCPLLPIPNITAISKPMKISTNLTSVTKLPSVTASPPADPNKRTFSAYGSAAALFVQIGAYRGGPTTFSVIGLSSKPIHVYGKPWYKCEYQSNSPSAPPVRAKAYKILPDWGYGRVYTVVVVNCTFASPLNADNLGGKLNLYAYYSPNPRRFEKFLALEEPPNSYSPSRFTPPFDYDYLYCGSSLYDTLSAQCIREWMAYHARFFGPKSHFVFHDVGGSAPRLGACSTRGSTLVAPRFKIDIREQENYDGPVLL